MEAIKFFSQLFQPSKWSLSKKFILILMLILLIPISSVGLLKEIEKALVGNLRDNLLLSASLLGNQLSKNKEWFQESLLPNSSQFIGKELYVFPLDDSFNLDGYFDDWDSYQKHRKEFEIQDKSKNNKQTLSLLVGYYEKHLMLSISVEDEQIIYAVDKRQSNDDVLSGGVYSIVDSADINKSDQLEIEFRDSQGKYQSIFLMPKASGEIAVYASAATNSSIDWRYKAYWIETNDGYDVEIKFPSDIKLTELRVVRKNTDRIGHEFNFTHSSSRYGLNPLVWPSKKFLTHIKLIKLNSAQRLWILDTHGRVLASSGNLSTSHTQFSSNPILNWILASQTELSNDPRADNLRLDSEGIYLALKGKPSTRIENIRQSDQSIAVATYPIKFQNNILGVLLLEENVARIQITQKKALINMFFIILTVLILVVWAIYWYVSKMVRRIKRLNQAIENVVDSQGRMNSPLILPTDDGDEIDDLNRSFSQMGERLFEYNEHLEKLASRLSHELRTPIAIVRSSLDNLLLNSQSSEEKDIIERALQGNQRLGEIISRMRQASGVKDAMQTAELIEVDFEQFMNQMIDGYSYSFNDHHFLLNCTLKTKHHKISPDLFAEMLDKLIANAMEFSNKKKPIKIDVNQTNKALSLQVSNSGPIIEKKNRKKIFQSLVSIRSNNQSTGTNLGLGLYVVKLIAEFHGAIVKVNNLDDNTGVAFSIVWKY